DEGEIHQAIGQRQAVVALARDRHGFLEPTPRAFLVAQQKGQVATAQERLQALGRGVTGVGCLEAALEPAAALAHTTLEVPEPAQRPRQATRLATPVVLEQPSQRSTQVLILTLQPAQPRVARRTDQMRLGLLCKLQEDLGVPLLKFVALGRGDETLPGVLAQRVEHREARLTVRLLLHA